MPKRTNTPLCARCGAPLRKPRLVALGRDGEPYHLECAGQVDPIRVTPSNVSWDEQAVEFAVVGGMTLGHLRDLALKRAEEPELNQLIADLKAAVLACERAP